MYDQSAYFPSHASRLEMLISHGRSDPAQDMKYRGFEGPVIKGIITLSGIYTNFTLWFDSIESMLNAKEMTGWDNGVDPYYSLQVRFYEDMIECTHTDEHKNKAKAYYGDWILKPGC